MSKVYTITLNPAIDRLLYLEEDMVRRKTNRIENVAYDIGGKGTHGSYAMSKLGIDNQALGFMGDLNAKKFKKILKAKNINHDFTEIKGQSTRECYIILDGTSGSTMLTEKGFQVNEDDVKRFIRNVQSKVKPEDMVLVAGSLPVNFNIIDLKNLILILQKIGCFIACDLSGEALQLVVQLSVDFIKPNEFELNELKEPNEGTLDVLKRLSKEIDYVVVSLGKSGSYCARNQEIYHVIPPNVKEVNDTGAGDCFVGAFISGIYKDYSIEETLKISTGCAASKVMHKDSSTFNLEDAMKLKEKVKIIKV